MTASIQDRLYTDGTCFGCGPKNPKGLQLKSFHTPDAVIANFLPWPEHDNGIGFLNGGVICTLLDCHSAAAVIQEADDRGWPPLPGAALAYVTAGLEVSYLRPCSLTEPVELRAVLREVSEPEMIVDVELNWDGKTRATAVARWKRWRPR